MLATASQAGVQAAAVRAYTGRCQVAMAWGPGHPGRRPALLQHARNGGHVVWWDLGYWHRDRAYRVTVDYDHPQRLLCDMPGNRFDGAGVPLREDYCAGGHIVLVGLGVKSRAMLGFTGLEWEERTFRHVHATYPDATIVYRPKKPEPFKLCGAAVGDVANVLRGASLVVCHHSNVAVDACIAGVPVVCTDGAAAALYTNDITNPLHATRAQRLAFLRRLAWWQWSPNEALEAWTFLKHAISA